MFRGPGFFGHVEWHDRAAPRSHRRLPTELLAPHFDRRPAEEERVDVGGKLQTTEEQWLVETDRLCTLGMPDPG